MRTLVLAVVCVVFIGTLVAFASYAARNTQLLANWHPMFVEKAFTQAAIGWFGHNHHPNPPTVVGDTLVGAPVTTCWDYDFLEKDCDGPDHYKAFLADGDAPDSKIGAYMGDESPLSPDFAKACGIRTNPYREWCVRDYRDDGRTVWLDTGRNLDRLSLDVGCPGPRSWGFPCSSVHFG